MKYFIYRTSNNSMYVCETLEDLIRWFARGNRKASFSDRIENDLFNNVAMNPNDTKNYTAWSSYNKTFVYYEGPRDIMVFDEYDRVIDPRHYKNEILNYTYKSSGYCYKRYGKYEFRRGPVPGIHKRHGGHWYRRPQTFQERRLSCDKEIKLYVRSARNMMNLPDSWDDISINDDHCWKAKKIEKQWMKNLK